MPLKTTAGNHGEATKGRGATVNIEGRFEVWSRDEADDGWFQDPCDEPSKPKTTIAIEQAKSVISRHNSPDVGFSQSINPYRGCEHACVYCVAGDTRVLMADGRTSPIASLKVGDAIYGTRLEGMRRRYVRSRVLAHWSTIKPAFRITLADGTQLVASGDHRFLARSGWRHVRRHGSPSLAETDQLFGIGRIAEAAQEKDYDRVNLSGSQHGRVGGHMRAISGNVSQWIRSESHWNRNAETAETRWRGGSTLRANRADLVALGIDSAAAIAMDIEGQLVESDARLRVVSIEPLGKAMRLYDITTETEDFIANGVVSHNCFARPTHAYLGLSPGLDFETRLSAKTNAAAKLREELSKPGYRCEPLTIGVNTDAYQPIERQYRITRAILEVAAEAKNPVSLITKSALIERDIDILAPMAKENLAHVTLSVTTLDHEISRRMEPRTSAPARRLLAIKRLSEAGIPVNVNIAPVIPFLTDAELEPIMEAAAKHGAISAGYVLVRLPWEVRPIFKAWLEEHFPLKAAHVMSRIRDMRDGRENDPNFGSRMVGSGEFAQLLAQRFRKGIVRFGLDRPWPELDCTRFVPPSPAGQKSLF